jgi:hypothetical protein
MSCYRAWTRAYHLTTICRPGSSIMLATAAAICRVALTVEIGTAADNSAVIHNHDFAMCPAQVS